MSFTLPEPVPQWEFIDVVGEMIRIYMSQGPVLSRATEIRWVKPPHEWGWGGEESNPDWIDRASKVYSCYCRRWDKHESNRSWDTMPSQVVHVLSIRKCIPNLIYLHIYVYTYLVNFKNMVVLLWITSYHYLLQFWRFSACLYYIARESSYFISHLIH